METRKQIASEKLQCGTHNCAQAIVSTYADLIDLDETTAKNIANAFGGGMGNMEGTCGALVGAGIVLGLATKDRAKSRTGMRQIMIQFQERGVGTGVVLRECTGCVADAAELLEQQLKNLE